MDKRSILAMAAMMIVVTIWLIYNSVNQQPPPLKDAEKGRESTTITQKPAEEPKPAVEAVADRTAPTFDYRPEATSGKGDRRGKSVIGDMGGRGDTSGTSEKGAAAEQIGASNPLVSPLESEGKDIEPIPTAQEEKPEVKPETKLDDGGKLVEMETFDPTNKVTAEVDSIKSLVKFETAEDAKDVLDRAQAGENDQISQEAPQGDTAHQRGEEQGLIRKAQGIAADRMIDPGKTRRGQGKEQMPPAKGRDLFFGSPRDENDPDHDQERAGEDRGAGGPRP